MTIEQHRAERADTFETVRAHIARRLAADLTVDGLARTAGYSPYHFVRAFAAYFGASPITYLRGLRLKRAAQRLERDTPPPRLIDLAFESGFESQEAFTRAFRKAYGLAPGRYRSAVRKRKKEFAMSASTVTSNVTRLDEMVKRDAFVIAGVAADFDDQSTSGIPSLWPRFIAKLPLPGQKGYVTYGAMWTGNAAKGSMRYMAAIEVDPDAKLPDDVERLHLAAQTYMVFRLTLDGAELHPQMQAASKKIWGKLLPESKLKPARGPDLEVYPADFAPNRKDATVDFYLPVEA